MGEVFAGKKNAWGFANVGLYFTRLCAICKVCVFSRIAPFLWLIRHVIMGIFFEPIDSSDPINCASKKKEKKKGVCRFGSVLHNITFALKTSTLSLLIICILKWVTEIRSWKCIKTQALNSALFGEVETRDVVDTYYCS